MTRKLLHFVFCCFILLSCKKDSSLDTNTARAQQPGTTPNTPLSLHYGGVIRGSFPASASLPDSIIYTDFNPDIIVNSAISTWNPGCGTLFLPVDTIVIDSIKLDPSGPFQYKFMACNFLTGASSANTCYSYGYSVDLNGCSSFDSIAQGYNSLCGTPKLMQAGDTVNFWTHFSLGVTLNYNSHPQCGGQNTFLTGPAYLGIKRVVGNQVYYGWINVDTYPGRNGVVIKECAINMRSGNKIACGQTH